MWPTTASPEQASLHWAAFVGGQLGTKPARYAGSKDLAKQKRVYGVVHYDDDAGNFSKSVASFERQLAKYKVKATVTIPYSLDLATAQQDARNIIAKLQSSGVTSVVLAGDPVFPSILTKEATAQGYFPEWVVLGYAFTDTTVFGRTYDQQQWAHAFGVSLLPARTADDVDELANVITWQTGQPPAAKTFRELVQAPLVFFTGVHLAGPNLTAKTFAAGLARYPADAPTVPTRLHLSWGRHGIWPGPRPHRRRRRHGDLVGREVVGHRRGGPRRQGDLALRRRRRALPAEGLAEAADQAVRPVDVDRRDHAAHPGGDAAELSLARGLIAGRSRGTRPVARRARRPSPSPRRARAGG